MKYTFSTLLIVLILAVSCDSESITNSFISENPPEAKIVILNEDELAEKSVGDSIDLEILLEVHNMVAIKNIQFSIGFNGEIFSPSNLIVGTTMVSSSSYQFKPNFFSLSGEPYTDNNGDGEWDEGEEFTDELNGVYDEGEEFTDINENGVYDEGEEFVDGNGEYDEGPISPVGIIMAEENSFEGLLGIVDPEQNGNKWGDGDICILHLSGIYTESIITLDIISALEYTYENTDAEASLHWDSWEITSTIEVASQYNPALTLVQVADSEEGIITIELEIEDSPKLADFSSVIFYDSEVLNVIEYEFLNFFNTTNYYSSYQNSIQEGKVSISSSHGIVSDPLTDIINEPINEGSGGIIKLKFFIADLSAVTTSLSIPQANIIARGYSSTDNLIYDYDINFWDIEENLVIDF